MDADPDQNLGEMVGVNLAETGKRTISDLLVETFLEQGGTTVGVPPTERIENKIWLGACLKAAHLASLLLEQNGLKDATACQM